MRREYFAHSGNSGGRWHPLREHLQDVACLAREFAGTAPWAAEAFLAGLAHDMGKFPDMFQNRLKGQEKGIDHWSPGAWIVLSEHHAVASALAIQGHHIGLQQGLKPALRELNPSNLAQHHPLNLRLSDNNMESVKHKAASEGIALPKLTGRVLDPRQPLFQHPVPQMLDVRMLFSCLTDADFLDTEAHFEGDGAQKRFREAGPALDTSKALRALDQFMEKIRAVKRADQAVLDARDSLWGMCSTSALSGTGVFTLTAPTGSGKTLAMLKFALEHAARNQLKRIVLAVPFLSIIEQTAAIYREVFKGFTDNYVLEHHSMAGLGVEDRVSADLVATERNRRLLSENWDAPIVLTTNVQLLESLFSNRPSSCRKLHNLRDSIIIFDEAQTLPQPLVAPTLAALAHLSDSYKSSVVFATATQPAFNTLDKFVREAGAPGWQPNDATPGHEKLYKILKRYVTIWPDHDERKDLDNLSVELGIEKQVLCVFNLKRHAELVLEKMSTDCGNPDGLFHLSTNLCPLHRLDVLADVRSRLKSGRPCRLISTQCVEAGVDVDFPVVFRALAPLDAIAQAAGRCNREGRLRDAAGRHMMGEVRVFEPDVEKGWRRRYPTYAYFQATEVTRLMLEEANGLGLDLNDPSVFIEYYRRLYDLSKPESQNAELQTAMSAVDFVHVAKAYRLIEHASIQVVAPYRKHLALYDELRRVGLNEGIDGQWMRQAQGLAVSVYRPERGDPAWELFAPAKLRRGQGDSDEWFILDDRGGNAYDEVIGLRLPKSQHVLIG